MSDAEPTYPLTQSQLQFWHGAQLAPDYPNYNMVWRFDLYQTIDAGRFAKALEDVIDGADAMRVAFAEINSTPKQYRGPRRFQLPGILDLSDAQDAEAALVEFLQDWVPQPFNLTSGTYRARLVRLSDDHWVWLSAQHHIACDAQSGALLFDAVSKQYLNPKLEVALPSYFEAAQRIVDGFDAALTSPKLARQGQTPPYGAAPQRQPVSTRVDVPVSRLVLDAFSGLGENTRFRLFTHDLTRLALFLTAYAAFLHRVTGDERVVIALPSHNRLSEIDRATMGLFVEVLPFVVDVTGEDNFETLFDRVKEGLGRFLRQARPNAVAQHDTRGPANVLNYIQARFGDFADQPAKVTWLHSGTHDAHHPIRLHVTDFEGAGARLALDISNDILEHVTAEGVAAQFVHLLSVVAGNTVLAIAKLPLCDDQEAVRIARACEGPAEPADAKANVLDLIHDNVRRNPTAIALREQTQTCTYADLWARAGGVAVRLQTDAPKAGPVAIHMRRSVDCIIAILGVLRAGRAFVPIAANTPDQRLASILNTCGATVAFGDALTAGALAQTGAQILGVDDALAVPFAVPPTKTAYVLFTSGSTGVPKGVEVSHAGLCRYILWAKRSFGGPGPVDYAFFSSLSFDLTITSLFTPLVSGGSMVIYPEHGVADLAVLDVFAEDAVDVVKLTPSHLALVCAAGGSSKRIKTLVLGGENLTTSLCRRARRVLRPDLEIINEYGPTEAVVGCMIHRFNPAEDTKASVPIGRSANGVAVTVRDAAMSVVPVGVKGEICISGRLATGYFNQPEQTTARFVDLEDGSRLYRTGDIGRLNSDGSMDYLGRADQQLKIGGVRIETAEIENALLATAGVTATHVAVTPAVSSSEPSKYCTSCGLPDNYPGATFNSDGVCKICEDFHAYKDRAQAYFQPEPELEKKLRDAAAKSTGGYDAVMLLSGGKDSTYAAYRLAALTSRVLAVTLDNGFIAEGAKANIARVVQHLGWDHLFLTTDKMNEIFVDSLNRHSNVCQGCFKALYTLAIRTARVQGAPIVVTGLSRGQFFETRLTPELFAKSAPTCDQLEHMVTEARKRYHGEDDAVARLLDTSDLADGRFLDEVDIVDIYRYIDVPVSEIYRFLGQETAWRKPPDTGRSTNCLINDVGIHVHKQQQGFHNYALPYSWDVRMGHKTRENALDELNDEIDEASVQGMLDQIGYDAPRADQGIIAYAVTDGTTSQADIWCALRDHLPSEAQPSAVVLLDALPLTPNGKVDTARLPKAQGVATVDHVPPATDMEIQLARILCAVIGATEVGRYTDFFDLGVDSLAAIQVAMIANDEQVRLSATALFEHRTLKSLAAHAETLGQTVALDMSVNLALDEDEFAAISQALS